MEVVPLDGARDPDPLDPPLASVPQESECPLVLVTWRDAWFDFDEPDPEDVRADYLVDTVGFLVRRGPRFVSVAQEILPDGDGFRAVTHIPVAVVETIAPLHASDEGDESTCSPGERVYSPGSARSTRRHVPTKKEGCEMTAHTVTVSAQRPSVSR